jgi:hypothetical protein
LNDINAEKLVNTRPLIKMKFIKKRMMFDKPFKHNEKEATDGSREIKPSHDPSFDYHEPKRIIDIGL